MNYLKSLLVVLCVAVFAAAACSQSKSNYYLLVGGYTKAVADKGISVYEFNAKDGSLQFRSVKGNIENPSYLAINSKEDKLYAVSEKGRPSGKVFAYQFDKTTGLLSLLNETSSGGRGPCYISIDKNSEHVFVANYSDGNIAAIALDGNGLLDSNRIQSIQHTGSSIDKDNQKGPHGHSIVVSPDQRFALSADLGLDRIFVYKYNPAGTTPLSEAEPAYVTVTPGSGPRHICFHPNGKYVYVVNELNGSVDAFDYNKGVLKHKQNLTMLPDGFHGTIEAADIHVSTDGKFLYASNREELNEIIIYSIAKNGLLKFVGRQSVLGAAPRNFVIDPTGKFLLVANMNTNEIIVFLRDAKTGLLQATNNKITTTGPACMKFIQTPH